MKSIKTAFVSGMMALALAAAAFPNMGPVSRAIVPTLEAQSFVHNTTTTSAAVGINDLTVSVVSASAASGSTFGAIAVGQIMMIDQEFMTVTSVSGTTIGVQRRGPKAPHASGSYVFIGASGSFQSTAPPMGTCTQSTAPKFWIVNGGAGAPGIGGDAIGNIYTCSTNGVWQQSSAPWLNSALDSGNGATVTLTQGQCGTAHLFDRAAGIIYTLPPPVPGCQFFFYTSVSVTSNAYTVQTNTGTVFVGGTVAVSGSTSNSFACNGTSHIKVASDGATKGGLIGSYQAWTAVSATLWNVSGTLAGSGTAATPCA